MSPSVSILCVWLFALCTAAKLCSISPLGKGLDDSYQVEAAIENCGSHGQIVFNPGEFNITRKMMWNLTSSKVDVHGSFNFIPDVDYWLDMNNTYQVVFIQSQSSWFVITGSDFEIDAHGTGGIIGNGQIWWDVFTNRTREDGDGRPISFTVWRANNGIIKDFKVDAPPFWCNAVAESSNIIYDGMICNATNLNPEFAGQNIVPNTDGIDTYRSDNITLLNWDITCGDDCIAIKGNSSNILVNDLTCRGGNGIAFGSLGQYVNLSDIVENVHIEGVTYVRLDPSIQPNMVNGIYFKTWTGTVNGVPPTGGGGGGGFVRNVVARNFTLDSMDLGVHIYQTNGGHSTDLPSQLMFSNLTFTDWTGTLDSGDLIDFECSPAVGCDIIAFANFMPSIPVGDTASCTFVNVTGLTGEPSACE